MLMQLGWNLAALTYYTTALELCNLAFPGTWWNNLPPGSPPTPVLGILPAMGSTQPDDYYYMRPGTYTLSCQGHGTLQFGCLDLPNGGQACVFPGGPYTFTLTGKYGITITILDNAGYANGKLSNVKLALRDLAIYGPGSVPTQTFQPTYLSALQGCACLRGMDWLNTNALQTTTWNPNMLTPLLNVPGLVELANATGRNLWLCIPGKAFGAAGLTNWCASAGAYVGANLDPKLTAYIEWANEPFNWDDLFFAYLTSLVGPLGVGDAGWPGVYAVGANACFEAFLAAMPAGGPRVQRVLCGQAGWYGGSLAGTQYMMKQNGWEYDLISPAPYLEWPNSGAYTNAALTALALAGGDAVGFLCEGLTANMATLAAPMAAWTNAVASYGKPMVYYECGIDCVTQDLWGGVNTKPVMLKAYQDPRYGAVVTQYLQTIAGFGATFGNWYNLCEPAWGALQNIDTPTSVYSACQSWIGANG
jgi:hypothetical protein